MLTTREKFIERSEVFTKGELVEHVNVIQVDAPRFTLEITIKRYMLNDVEHRFYSLQRYVTFEGDNNYCDFQEDYYDFYDAHLEMQRMLPIIKKVL